LKFKDQELPNCLESVTECCSSVAR